MLFGRTELLSGWNFWEWRTWRTRKDSETNVRTCAYFLSDGNTIFLSSIIATSLDRGRLFCRTKWSLRCSNIRKRFYVELHFFHYNYGVVIRLINKEIALSVVNRIFVLSILKSKDHPLCYALDIYFAFRIENILSFWVNKGPLLMSCPRARKSVGRPWPRDHLVSLLTQG